jgi:hypothetical protein
MVIKYIANEMNMLGEKFISDLIAHHSIIDEKDR